jgi:hypothetical protein
MKNANIKIFDFDEYKSYAIENNVYKGVVYCPANCDLKYMNIMYELYSKEEKSISKVYVYEFDKGVLVLPVQENGGRRTFWLWHEKEHILPFYGVLVKGDAYAIDFSVILDNDFNNEFKFFRYNFGGYELFNAIRGKDVFPDDLGCIAGSSLLTRSMGISNLLDNQSRHLRSNVNRVLNKDYSIYFGTWDIVVDCFKGKDVEYQGGLIKQYGEDFYYYLKQVWSDGLVFSSKLTVDGMDSYEYGFLYGDEYFAHTSFVAKSKYSIGQAHVALVIDKLFKMGIKYYNHGPGIYRYKYVWSDHVNIPNFLFKGNLISKRNLPALAGGSSRRRK